MFQAVRIRSPASAGIAIPPASGAAAIITISTVTAWIIPATGVRPPARTFVAVRAIAPVAGSPATSDEPRLATPCARSSASGRCRAPGTIRSATTAERSDSIPARKAITRAEGRSSAIRATDTSGSAGQGSRSGSAPKRPSIVATPGRTAASADPAATARIRPGQRGAARRKPAIIAIVASPTARDGSETVPRAAQSAGTRSRNPAGSCARRIPRRSLIWLVAMIAAMPRVKPLITASGTSPMIRPARKSPAAIRITPAMKVAITSPSKPCAAITPATTTMNAPVGPPICTRLPPSAEIRNPATTAVTRPVTGSAPLAIAMARLSGMATMATVTPVNRSARNCTAS